MEWLLELVLVLLLALTLFHALRLERALGVLQRDRAALEEFVATFNTSTRQAEQGVERLHAAADGAGRQITRQVEAAVGLKDDLLFLVERGERLADRLDGLVRAARALAPDAGRFDTGRPDAGRLDAGRPDAGRPDAGRLEAGRADAARVDLPAPDLPHHDATRQEARPALAAREFSRLEPPAPEPPVGDPPPERAPPPQQHSAQADAPAPQPPPDPTGQPRLRSQAERDLLKALRAAR